MTPPPWAPTTVGRRWHRSDSCRVRMPAGAVNRSVGVAVWAPVSSWWGRSPWSCPGGSAACSPTTETGRPSGRRYRRGGRVRLVVQAVVQTLQRRPTEMVGRLEFVAGAQMVQQLRVVERAVVMRRRLFFRRFDRLLGELLFHLHASGLPQSR